MAREKPRPPQDQQVAEPNEVQEGQDQGRPLEFNEALTWRPGKAIPVAELLRRLRALSEELAEIDQEDADRESLVPKAQELASPQLLCHKDKGVKAYTLLCIVEMFRLLAPDAPYKSGQLREIFTVFTSTVVPALANPSDPYNQQHSAALTSLATVKSIILISDVSGSEHLTLNLFTNCFDVMSGSGRSSNGERLPKNLEYHMTHMLEALVEESDILPSGAIDIILAQFLRADPSAQTSAGKKSESQSSETVTVTEHSPAYSMARSLCNTAAAKMSPAIGQYFTSVLLDASSTVEGRNASNSRGRKRTHDESEDESDDGLLTPPAEEDLQEVEKAHRLLRELWRSAPNVIQNVMQQLETELEAENTHLRTLAVQTVGDMVSGIGASGFLPPQSMDPAAYPSQSLDESFAARRSKNELLEPNAPHAFAAVYASTYARFSQRYKDKAFQVRMAWATAAGRIVATSGGGKGLDKSQQDDLVARLSGLLQDTDERVRLAAVQAIDIFDYRSILQKLTSQGGVTTPGSLLSHLADRIKDRKHPVRVSAMELLGRLWGVAAGAITEGSERVRDLFGAIPSKILEAVYVNDAELNALVQRVLFDSLLPISFPPIKPKQMSEGDSELIPDSQNAPEKTPDPDAIRAKRILTLVRDLEEKAQKVFFALQQKQVLNAKYMEMFLKACDDNNKNGDTNTKETKKKLEKLIDVLSRLAGDPVIASSHLKRFAKHNDRRSYQLVRFCYSPESDFRKIVKAMKEHNKRSTEAPSDMVQVLETLIPLVRSCAILIYNRSHVPAIVDVSRTNESGLGTAAHEVLKEISTKVPDIFKAHVHELCETLKKQTPRAGAVPEPALVDTLKACSGFARRFPDEMPADREFYKAMVTYAVHGIPPKAAKHAVTVIVSSADRKAMYIQEILTSCIENFEYGGDGFVSKLAAISQLRLLAGQECEDHSDAIMNIAVTQVLGEVRTAAEEADREWREDMDDEISAKLWALRILVNGLRGFEVDADAQQLKEVAGPVYKLLNTLVRDEGELHKTTATPKHHAGRLRLAAAVQLLKLSRSQQFDRFLTLREFNQLSKVLQDPVPEVRTAFIQALTKHLGSLALPNRFIPLLFLSVFEPKKEVKESTTTWLKSRAARSAKLNDTVMEGAFARLLSLLAHHPDFDAEDIEGLTDFVDYILFYLNTVATESILPSIFAIAQRVKGVKDGIDPEKSENLYVLSDIAQAVIRAFQEQKNWQLRTVAVKSLPSGLFQKLPSHESAQAIADKNFIPEDLASEIEEMVKRNLRPKKRKSDGSSSQAFKKSKPEAAAGKTPAEKSKPAVRKTPKPAKVFRPATTKSKAADDVPSSAVRKSSRTSNARSYAENDDSEDDEEMEQWQVAVDNDEDMAEADSSTPPTSDPTPVPDPQTEEQTEVKRPARKTSTRASQLAPQKPATRQVPARATRASTQTRAGAKKERDVMSIPSDSDEDLSDVPSDVEA